MLPRKNRASTPDADVTAAFRIPPWALIHTRGVTQLANAPITAVPVGRSARCLRQIRLAAAHAVCGRSGWPQRTLSAADPVGRSARYLRQIRTIARAVEPDPPAKLLYGLSLLL